MWKRSSSVNKRLGLLLALALTALALAGCGAGERGRGTEPAVTFTDALGRTVTLPEKPARTAALLGSFADVWQLAGGTVCAAASDAWVDFGLELDGAVNLGGAHSPSLEALLSANPDFVIASASTAADVALKETLETAGIPVAYFEVTSFEDYLAMLEVCTGITGRQDLLEQNGYRLREQIETVRAACRGASLPEEERRVLVVRASSGSVKAKDSSGTVLGEMLSDLGCINIADSDKTLLENLSAESVIRQEPRRIFVVTMGEDTEKARENFRRMLEENPAWGTLEAVREGRIYFMDKQLYNLKPNARWAESYEKLSDILLENQ